jgi:uncharacterized damage-inducible protein DinB
MMAARKQISVLLHILDEAYDLTAWHGPNLRGAIRGMNASVASRRPGRGRHSIWELVVHAAYWKYAVRRRITGERRGTFPLKGSNWFVRPGPRQGHSWKDDVALLDEEHRLLRATVASLTDRDCARKPRGSSASVLRLVAGVAAHDLYHAGQIRLLKRLGAPARRASSRRRGPR